MRQIGALLLAGVLTAQLGVAAGVPEQRQEPAAATETAAAVGAPTGLRLRIVGSNVHLTWAAAPRNPGDVTGYEIVRADVFSGPYETVGKVDKGSFSFVDQTAQPEIIYFYKVRAIVTSGYSPFSREAAGEITGRP